MNKDLIYKILFFLMTTIGLTSLVMYSLHIWATRGGI